MKTIKSHEDEKQIMEGISYKSRNKQVTFFCFTLFNNKNNMMLTFKFKMFTYLWRALRSGVANVIIQALTSINSIIKPFVISLPSFFTPIYIWWRKWCLWTMGEKRTRVLSYFPIFYPSSFIHIFAFLLYVFIILMTTYYFYFNII